MRSTTTKKNWLERQKRLLTRSVNIIVRDFSVIQRVDCKWKKNTVESLLHETFSSVGGGACATKVYRILFPKGHIFLQLFYRACQ